MFVIVYFTPLLLFFHQTEAAQTALTSAPLNPSTAIETNDLTLVWSYTLHVTIGIATFNNVTGDVKDEIARKTGPDGNIIVKNNYKDRFSAGISDTQAWLKILNVQRSDQGKYEFNVIANSSGSIENEVEVIVHYAPTVTIQQCSTPVTEGDNVTLYCNATGIPVPNIAWIRASTGDILSNQKAYTIYAIKRNESGSYKCLAWNGVGNNSTKSCTIDVNFPPEIKLQDKYFVGREKSVSLHCQVEGYPQPKITWTPCIPQGNVCGNSRLNISKVQTDADFNCTVYNTLGNDSASTSLIIGAKKINLTLIITSEEIECAKGATSFWEDLQEAVKEIFANKNGYVGATLLDTRCGSVIVDLVLEFKSVVSEAWVISTLRGGIIDGKLGEFPVNASSIVGIPVIESTATPPTGKTTTKRSDDTNIGLIVGCAVGGFIALVIIIALVIWCVRKNNNKDKDKKRKSNKEVSDNDAEGYNMAQFQGSHPTQGYGNNGYENTGSTSRPPAANAGKKDKKGKKKQDEPEKPVGVVYAQVDKSKRTSKPKEPEPEYEQAARPNSKRPGELQYASPEDLHQGQSMSRNSGAQPKKPEAYTETQYAVLV